MASKSETGHAVNVAAMGDLLSVIKSFKTKYDPALDAIKVANIEIHYTAEKAALLKVRSEAAPWMQYVNEREAVNEKVDKYLTRVYNAFSASDVLPQAIADVKSFINKIKGIRVSAKIVTVPGDPGTPTDESIKQVSASQKGFDNRVDNLTGLVEFLKVQPNYTPNEVELQTTTIEALVTELTAKNDKVVEYHPPVVNARIERDKLLYSTGGGAELSGKVKRYVRSVFGGNSPEYHAVASIKFTKPNIKF
jgi:hypothetical protein